MPVVAVALEEDVDFICVSVFMADEPDAASEPLHVIKVGKHTRGLLNESDSKLLLEARLTVEIGKAVVSLLKSKGEL